VQNNDTIVSLATVPGESALGIIRVSGSLCKQLCCDIFNSPYPIPRKSYLKYYNDINKNIIDHVIFVYYELGRSYTGEEMIEISFHGNTLIADQILDDLINRKCRLADPGEYTKRAFLNGKIDLTQAESIAELINAKSEIEIEIAKNNLMGKLSEFLLNIRENLLFIQSNLEAIIDFPEDDIETKDYSIISTKLDESVQNLKNLSNSIKTNDDLKKGIKVLLLGPPNAGKSSIFNVLLLKQRAIVHDKPGTTRDYLSQKIKVGKYNIELIDSAGIRQQGYEEENLGMNSTIELIDESNLILLVFDSSLPYPSDFNNNILNKLKDKNVLIIENKSDLERKINPADYPVDTKIITISTFSKNSRNQIISNIESMLISLYPHLEKKDLIVNKRQFLHLNDCLAKLNDTTELLKKASPEEIIVQELKIALESIDQVIGQSTNEDMLDQLFSNFCIGK
jgi:tRNA modification GTPase